jgi:predicted nucleic acid-binding Zn ribbon protein
MPGTRTCAHCGAEFTPVQKTQKYCSAYCRNIAGNRTKTIRNKENKEHISRDSWNLSCCHYSFGLIRMVNGFGREDDSRVPNPAWGF